MGGGGAHHSALKGDVVAKAEKGKGKSVLAALADMPSALLGRLRLIQRAGIQYRGNRDIYAAAGYLFAPKWDDYNAYYTRNEIGARIIEVKAKTTWRSPPEIQEADESQTESKFTQEFEKLADRLRLWSEFEVVDRRSGIGRYGVLYIGVRGTDANLQAKPLQRLSSPDDILYVRAYDERHAAIETWVTDPNNPRFGLPDTYRLTVSDHPGFAMAGMLVHASRVLHVAEDADDRVYGKPRLERVLNRIFDLDKIAASTGESYWQAVSRILQAKIDPQSEQLTDAQLTDLASKLAEMTHDLRRQFYGQGVELSWLTSQVSPVKDIAEFYFSLIALGSGVPQRILFGNEQGKLASTMDQATFFGMIDERQEHFAEPQLVRAFIDKLIDAGALPVPASQEYDVVWPDLFSLTEEEQANTNLKRAQAAAALTPIGGDPLALVEIDENRDVWLVPKDPGNPDDVLANKPAPSATPAPEGTTEGAPTPPAGDQKPSPTGGAGGGGDSPGGGAGGLSSGGK